MACGTTTPNLRPPFTARAVFTALAFMVLGGCNTPEQVTITNATTYLLYVQVALPYPAYEMLDNHLRYSVRVEPGESWSTGDAGARDRADVEMVQPNGVALLRLYQYGQPAWSAYALRSDAELFEIDPVTVRVRSDDGDAFIVDAANARGHAVEVVPVDDAAWFARP